MHSALKALICSTALLLTLPLSPALAAEEGDSSGAAMDQLLQEPEIGYYEMKPDFVKGYHRAATAMINLVGEGAWFDRRTSSLRPRNSCNAV